MPTLWESSKRPMYVKTVWVDGFRHAILTHDDPYLVKQNAKKKRPHSSFSYAGNSNLDPKQLNLSKFRKTRLSHNEDLLGECLKKLNFVIKTDKTPTKHRIHWKKTEHLNEIEKLDLTELDSDTDDELVLKANAQRLNDYETTKTKYNSICTDNMKTIRSNRTSRTDNNKENNELSERVFQWLDLAGKVDILGLEYETTRTNQQRHSWPEIPKRNQTNTKTSTELKRTKGKQEESSKAGDSAKDKSCAESAVIDRHDFYVTTPANTIENYAMQSRNVKDTPRNDGPKSKESMTKIRDNKSYVEQTRQKIANEIYAVEKQYAELINKKIIPNYNKQGSRRQVHIFVPTVPKKTVPSTGTSRTESLLS